MDLTVPNTRARSSRERRSLIIAETTNWCHGRSFCPATWIYDDGIKRRQNASPSEKYSYIYISKQAFHSIMNQTKEFQDFCREHYAEAKRYADMTIAAHKKSHGPIDHRIYIDDVKANAVISALENAFMTFDASKNTKLATYLSFLVHNDVLSELGKEWTAVRKFDIIAKKRKERKNSEEGEDAKEINQLIGKTKETGYALIPTKLYLKDGFAKIELALAKGKKNYDKRESLKQKDAKRDIDRSLRERNKA